MPPITPAAPTAVQSGPDRPAGHRPRPPRAGNRVPSHEVPGHEVPGHEVPSRVALPGEPGEGLPAGNVLPDATNPSATDPGDPDPGDPDFQLREAARQLRRTCGSATPRWGVILGSGLGGFVDHIHVQAELDTTDLPSFPRPTALGHQARWVLGSVDQIPLLVAAGRLHRYEGFSYRHITHNVRLMRQLGVTHLVLSNASGGINPRLKSGDIVMVQDHIDLMGLAAAAAPSDRSPRPVGLGRRSDLYAPELIDRVQRLARHKQIRAAVGVYAGMSGPNYETRAEYRFLRRIGADVVGMSTIPEIVCAAQLGMRSLALSVVTNVCRPDCLSKTDGMSVCAAAAAAEPALRELVLSLIRESRDLLSGAPPGEDPSA